MTALLYRNKVVWVGGWYILSQYQTTPFIESSRWIASLEKQLEVKSSWTWQSSRPRFWPLGWLGSLFNYSAMTDHSRCQNTDGETMASLPSGAIRQRLQTAPKRNNGTAETQKSMRENSGEKHEISFSFFLFLVFSGQYFSLIRISIVKFQLIPRMLL